LSINEIAARGFSSAADVYERGRPGYAPEAIAWVCERLGIGPGRTVLDLAAGTGKLTRDLVPTGARVIAVEPLDEMRAHLQRVSSEVEALKGTAEDIPLADASVDAVVCAQAFHWFDPERALPEIHRVLRPGGGLALLYNSRDLNDRIQKELDDMLEPYRDTVVCQWTKQEDFALSAEGLFAEGERRVWKSEQRVTLDVLLETAASRSYIASLDEDVRAELLGRIRLAFADEPEPIHLLYDVYVGVSDRIG
jgi:SAM-dependent methyltransferase